MRPRILNRAKMPKDTVELARYLIGKLVLRSLPGGVAGGRIVETEAYDVGDLAGHGTSGKTSRNRSLFLDHGHAYVYLAYGTSWMFNVSSETVGVGTGVLIRAIEPTLGIPLMQRNRGSLLMRDLARGPGRLCAALQIDRQLDGIDLCQPGQLWLASGEAAAGGPASGGPASGGPASEIGVSKRIGITRAADSPLRFYLRGSRFVSGPQALNA